MGMDIYAALLGRASSGGGGGGSSDVIVVHEDADGALDMTWQEIFDAISSNKLLALTFSSSEDKYAVQAFLYSAIYNEENVGYEYGVNETVGGFFGGTDSPNGYPVRD